MRIKMLVTVPGSVDGVVSEYVAGEEYEFQSEAELDLAGMLTKHGYGVTMAQVIDNASTPNYDVGNEISSRRARNAGPRKKAS